MAWDAPTSFRIRDVEIAPNAVLAPMEGVTDLTFRRLIRSIGGCGLTVTEFVSGDGLYRNIARAMDMAQFDPDERPVAIQIYGREPTAMAEGARIAQDLGPDIVDLNMGCPSKKVCAHSGGSALMREPDRARQIVAAMRRALDVPFTVKMRAGWDPDHRNAPEIAYMCQEEGAEAVTVHWRTRADLYGGERELDTLAEVKSRLAIPVLANGDILHAEGALDTLRHTGCDGVMIGRGAIRDPWVFLQIQRAQRGLPPLRVDEIERKRVLLSYFAAIRDRFQSDHGALGRFKKISRYFTGGVHDGARLRQSIFHAPTAEEAISVVEAFFAEVGGPDGRPARGAQPLAEAGVS